MKPTRFLTLLALIAALALPACAKKEPQKAPEQSEKSGAKSEKKTKKTDPVKAGVKQMRTELDDLRSAVQAGDAAGAKQSAAALDATWEKIEGQVKERDPERYTQIEQPLHAVIAGVGVTPLDKQVVGDQVDALDGQLAQLQGSKQNGGKAAKKVDAKTGAAAMRYHLGQARAMLTQDTASVLKSVTAADETWEQIHDQVKKQDKETYAKIEAAMHSLLAAVQATPLDQKKVAEQLPKVDALLAELVK